MSGKTYLQKIFLAVFCAAAFIAFACGNSAAQITEVSSTRQKARTTIRPKAKPTAKKVDYNKRITVTRVEKKSRRNYRRTTTRRTTTRRVVRKVSVLPLAVQLRLLKVDEAGKETEVDPQTQFTPTDRLRLSLKANQRGYLYVVRQKAQDEDGEIIFPTQIVNNGSNYVLPNLEYVLPSNCPKTVIPNPIDCSLTLEPAEVAPMEFFTVIFTRDSLVDLPENAQTTTNTRNKRVGLIDLMSSGKIPVTTLIALIEESGQDLVSQQGDSPFAVRIINQDVTDNEEIIETFVLVKKQN